MLITEILDIIQKNVNSLYFDERYLSPLVNKLFSLQNPIKAREQTPRLQQFFALDCPSFFPKISEPNFLETFSKLGNAFKLEGLDFSGYWELIAHYFKSVIDDLSTEQILTVLINMGYAARVEAPQLFKWARDEFSKRVQLHYNPKQANLYITGQDIPKIMNTFIHYGQFDNQMKGIINQQIEDSLSTISYEVLAEVLIIYAENAIPRNLELFKIVKDKLIRGIPYLDSNLVYKLLWAFQKGGYLDSRIAFQFLQCLTEFKSYQSYETQSLLDFLTLLWKTGLIFPQNILKSQIQTDLVKRLEQMNTSQLLHTMWLFFDINGELERRNPPLQEGQKKLKPDVKLSRKLVNDLEMYIYHRLSQMGDTQLAIFLQCLVQAQSVGRNQQDSQLSEIFSQRIMEKVLKQISDEAQVMRVPIKAQIMFALTREGMKAAKFRVAKDGKKVVKLINKLEETLLQDIQALDQEIISIGLWCHALQPFLNPETILQYFRLVRKLGSFSDSHITRILQALSRIEQCVRVTPLPHSLLILQECRLICTYLEPFIEQQIEHFSPEQFASLFATYMRARDAGPLASHAFEAFLEERVMKNIWEFNQVHLSVFLIAIKGRNKAVLEQYLKNAKQQLSERELLAEIGPKLREKIRSEVESKIKEKKQELGKKSDYEVPSDSRLQSYSKREAAYSKREETDVSEIEDGLKYKE